MVALLISGCATQTRQLTTSTGGLPEQAELVDTPFFPQDRQQCGPAALATTLLHAGYPADPASLEARVFVPSLGGSLQPEMLAGARRLGALALPVQGTLTGLFAEIAAGIPVIVLQNLGLSMAPRWHYAVVVGFDLRRREVVLRSGPNRREIMSMGTFERTWARSDYWGMMTLRPGDLPHHAERPGVEKALSRLEKYAEPVAMLGWYRQAARRWPDSLAFMIGLGHAAHATGHTDEAEQALRTASERHPQSAAALNNLAIVLQGRGKLEEALSLADRAVALGGEWQTVTQATRDAIALAIRNPSAADAAPAGTATTASPSGANP